MPPGPPGGGKGIPCGGDPACPGGGKPMPMGGGNGKFGGGQGICAGRFAGRGGGTPVGIPNGGGGIPPERPVCKRGSGK